MTVNPTQVTPKLESHEPRKGSDLSLEEVLALEAT